MSAIPTRPENRQPASQHAKQKSNSGESPGEISEQI
ncbi:hypothetical protein A2U01_0117987, partial [Trifolium medium]|nr:hypothetical protein [Trifolium medium]